jgi:protein TonB
MAPDATKSSTSTPRRFAAAEIDSTASLPSPASQASIGADGDQAASVIFNPAPRYPPAALAARQTGRVVLRVTVSASGEVLKASVYRTSGISSLDAAALEAVRGWGFRPALQAGVPIEKEIAVPIRFTLAGP